MKFKLVESINSEINNLAIDTLTEGNNTNLRGFLLSLLDLAKLNNEFVNPVVHHTTKDTKRNSIYELVIMENSDHIRMHNKYRNKEWDINAHKPYKYIEVLLLVDKALLELHDKSQAEEKKLANETQELHESLISELNSLPTERGISKVFYDLIKQYKEVLRKFPVGTVLKYVIDAGEETFVKTESGDIVSWWEHFRAPWKDTKKNYGI